MAFDSPPYAMDGSTQDAELFRRAIGTLLSPAGGIVTPGDLTVTQNGTPNMSVNIGTGQVWVPGSSTPTQGLYYSRNAAAINAAIGASSPSLPRVDQIVVQVDDIAYAGAAKDIKITVVAGTPTSGASLANLVGLGTVPASSLVIAYVLVPANATTIVTADISNVAVPVGHAPVAWQALTLATNVNAAVGGYLPSARLEGDVVRLKGTMVNNTGSTIIASTTWATLPAGLRPGFILTLAVGGSGTSLLMQILTGGDIRLQGAGTPNGGGFELDGVSFTLS